MAKILVTGSRGTLGKYVKASFKNSSYELFATDRRSLDVTDGQLVKDFILKSKPDFVIHLAALTNVDYCEKNPKEALATNTTGTKNLVLACKKLDIPFIFISTSAVFSGEKVGYSERSTPNPLNKYGQSKMLAEQIIKKYLKKYYIIRAGWLIGGGKLEKKFISYIFNDIKKGKNVSVVNDKWGTITYAAELAEFIKFLIEEKIKYGIYHFGSSGLCSRLDIANHIQKFVNKGTITPIPSTTFDSVFFAPRPRYEVLTTNKIPFINHWQKSLENYIQDELI